MAPAETDEPFSSPKLHTSPPSRAGAVRALFHPLPCGTAWAAPTCWGPAGPILLRSQLHRIVSVGPTPASAPSAPSGCLFSGRTSVDMLHAALRGMEAGGAGTS